MTSLELIIPTAILLAGVVNDIKSQRVRNPLVIALAAIGLISSTVLFGLPGLQTSLMSAGFAFICALPLYMARVFGGGDLKLFVAFGFATGWTSIIGTLLASLFWGATLGVIRAIAGGQFKTLIFSTLSVAKRKGTVLEDLHKIPYSFALLIGWLTQITLSRLPPGVLW